MRGCSPLEREVVYTLRCSSDVFANCFILACLHAEICSTIAPYLNHSLCRWCLVVTRIQQAAGLNELKPLWRVDNLQPLGASDYLEMSRLFDTIFIRHIPLLTINKKTQARRLITLVDALYDHKVSARSPTHWPTPPTPKFFS